MVEEISKIQLHIAFVLSFAFERINDGFYTKIKLKQNSLFSVIAKEISGVTVHA